MKKIIIVIALLIGATVTAAAQNLEYCKRVPTGGCAVKSKEIAYTVERTLLDDVGLTAAQRFSFFFSDTPTNKGGLFHLVIIHKENWYVKDGEGVALMFTDGSKQNTVTGLARSEPYGSFYRTMLKLPVSPGELIKMSGLDALGVRTSDGRFLSIFFGDNFREKFAEVYMEAYDGFVEAGWKGTAL